MVLVVEDYIAQLGDSPFCIFGICKKVDVPGKSRYGEIDQAQVVIWRSSLVVVSHILLV